MLKKEPPIFPIFWQKIKQDSKFKKELNKNFSQMPIFWLIINYLIKSNAKKLSLRKNTDKLIGQPKESQQDQKELNCRGCVAFLLLWKYKITYLYMHRVFIKYCVFPKNLHLSFSSTGLLFGCTEKGQPIRVTVH